LEQADGKALGRLDGLAGRAGADVLIDECPHPWPVERAGEPLERFVSSEMAGDGGVVSFLEQVGPEGAFRDVEPGRGRLFFLVQEAVSDLEVGPALVLNLAEQALVRLVFEGGCLDSREEALGRGEGLDGIEDIVGAAAEGISHGVVLSGAVDDLQVELLDEVQPACLPFVELGLGQQELGGPVVSDDSNSSTMEVVAPLLETVDDREEFLIVDWVVALGWDHLAGFEGHNAPVPALPLAKDLPNGELGSIALEDEGLGAVGEAQDGCGGEGSLEGLEGCLGRGRPDEGDIAGEGSEWRSDLGEIFDKPAVEVG
jgi:hypothetical protein